MTIRNKKLSIIVLVLLFTGICLAPLFFLSYFVGFLGISFLSLAIAGIVYLNLKTREFKRTNPELYEKERAEFRKKAEETRAREVRFSDFPRWMLVLLIVVVVVGFADGFGLLRLNTSLETVVGVLAFLFIVYYLYYDFKIIRKKRKASSPSLSQKQEL
jgi:hypothetical protein